jgi:tetrahydromethanopterin S-methyltransferase subunit G
MAEVSNELIYKLMLEIQDGQQQARAEQETLTARVGTVATSLVSMMKRLDDIDARMTVFSLRQQEQTNTIRLVAVAGDDHTHRLDKIDSRLERIEKHIGFTHA